DGSGKIENDLVFARRLPHVDNSLANFERELEFRARETFGRIFEADFRSRADQGLRVFLQMRNGVRRDLDDVFFFGVKHVFALRRRSRIVKVENDVFGPGQSLERPDDQILAALAQYLDGYVVGDAVFFDQPSYEIEFY